MEPKDNKEDEVRPHVYDGIQEYNNRLPNWWLWTFYGAIIFSVIYWFGRYDAEIMKSDVEIIEAQMEKVEESRLAAMGEINDETLWQMSENSGFISAGKEIYIEKCLACHGPNLEGGIGLNLIDNEWKWGNKPISIYSLVVNGSPDKAAGMQAWMSTLGPKKVNQVVAFVLSHHTKEDLENATTSNPPVGL